MEIVTIGVHEAKLPLCLKRKLEIWHSLSTRTANKPPLLCFILCFLSPQGACFYHTLCPLFPPFCLYWNRILFPLRKVYPWWELHACINGDINVSWLKSSQNLLICILYNSAVRMFSLQKNWGIFKAFNGGQKREITENQFYIFEVWNAVKGNVLSTIFWAESYDHFFLL